MNGLFNRRALAALVTAAIAVAVAGCGSDGVDIAKNDSTYRGATLFNERCSGCHTLSLAGSQGSKPTKEINSRDRTNGPNFDTRTESRDDALFAIRNGGFSGAVMPANIVTGEDAEAVADFLAKYAGKAGN